jgi:hypothetical protein
MHLITDTLTHMNTPTKATLAVGYALSLPPFLAIVPALRDPSGRARFLRIPHRAVIVAELLGAGCVTAGWFAAGEGARNIINVAWTVACTTIWIRSENKLRLQRLQRAETGD